MNTNEKTEAMLKGRFVYYNFLRPHSALNGKNPAEAARIQLNLENRLETIIELATKWKAEKNSA